MTSLLEQLPKIVADGKREAELVHRRRFKTRQQAISGDHRMDRNLL